MSFAPEANGSWYTWGFHHALASGFVAAWRHVVGIFRSVDRTREIRWVWIMNVNYQGSENLADLWPGSAYVNILGIDGYFPGKFETFETCFGPTIVSMRSLSSQPLLITETADAPSAGKQQELNQLVIGVAEYGLEGFLWFDVRQHGSLTRQDWSLEQDPAAFQSFGTDVNQLK